MAPGEPRFSASEFRFKGSTDTLQHRHLVVPRRREQVAVHVETHLDRRVPVSTWTPFGEGPCSIRAKLPRAKAVHVVFRPARVSGYAFGGLEARERAVVASLGGALYACPHPRVQ